MESGARASETGSVSRRGGARFEVLAALLLLAFAGWFALCRIGAERGAIADDAYITYGYARQVAEGHGLRFNATDADPTPGCSTELHALLAAAAIARGFDPLVVTRVLSVVSVLAIGILLGIAGAHLSGAGARRGLLVGAGAAWVLTILPETSVHLTSGMETLLFALAHAVLVAWAAWACARREGLRGPVVALAVPAVALCTLARPEGSLLAALTVAAVIGARSVARASGRPSRKEILGALREGAPLVVVTAVLLGAYFAWRLGYYGSLLGNPYYVKSSNAIFGSRGERLPGLEASAGFAALRIGPLLIALLLARHAIAPARAVRDASLLLLVPSVCMLGAYTFVVHEMAAGSRFEYPMLVPWLGAACTALLSLPSPAAFGAILVGATIVAPALAAPVHGEWLDFARHPRSAALAGLRRAGADNALARAGRDLGETGLGPRATILLSAAGQIPWYSRFTAIDWIGLNDTRLSGRTPLTIDEVWSTLRERNPDVVQSILPPAARASTNGAGGPDENFASSFVQATLDGRGSVLFAHWDRERLARMFQAEMDWVRERCVFGACYKLGSAWGDDWWVFLYVRKDSPHRERLLEVLRGSRRADVTSDLSARFPFDPRRLTD